MESSSARLVHWKRKPRSRMVFRKGDLRAARAFASFSSSVRSSSSEVVVEDVAATSASAVDAKRVEN